MVRDVVVGVADATSGRSLLPVGSRLAAAMGGELRLVHVVDVSEHKYGELDSQAIWEASEAARGEHMLADLATSIPALPPTTTMIRHGDVAEVLADEAQSGREAVLVVGSRGLGPVRGRLLGSVSRRLLERSATPLVIVTPQASSTPWTTPGRGVLVGYDGSQESRAALSVAADLAQATREPLTLAHVEVLGVGFTAADRSAVDHVVHALSGGRRAMLEEAATHLPVELPVTHAELWGTSASEALIEEARTTGHDLIVVGTRAGDRWRRALMGSVARGLMAHSPVPVVVVHSPHLADSEPDAARRHSACPDAVPASPSPVAE